MSKMIETLNATIEFLSSYPTWAKVLMVTGISISILTTIFVPRDKKDTLQDNNTFAELIDNTAKSEELKAKILLNKEILPNYLKSKSEYDALNYTYNLKIDNDIIDVALFYHYNEQTQAIHYLVLTKFYDIDTENVKWEELDNDWEKFSESISYEKIKHALANANGFNSPIEFQNPMGGENFRPKILFAQICGRRKGLNAIDLAKMQQINSEPKAGIYRFPVTYDFILSGFNGLM